MAVISRRLVKFRGEDKFAYVQQYRKSSTGSGNAGGGVQWQSCNSNISPVQFGQGGSSHAHITGVSPILWLFLIPGMALTGIAIGVASPAGISGLGIVATIEAAEAAVTALALSFGALTGLRAMEFVKQAGEMLASLLPSGCRVQFVKFTKPCKPEDYEGD